MKKDKKSNRADQAKEALKNDVAGCMYCGSVKDIMTIAHRRPQDGIICGFIYACKRCIPEMTDGHIVCQIKARDGKVVK